MASSQHQLISRIIKTGCLSEVLEWGITAGDFTQSETLSVFQLIASYHQAPETAGSVWGPEMLKSKFPNFPLSDDESMTTDALCIEVRRDRLTTALRKKVVEIDGLIDNDPFTVISELTQYLTDLQNDCASKKVDTHITDGVSRIWEQYLKVAAGEQVGIAPWPWEPLQKATLGLRVTDYIILFGRPKSMKTWVLCYLIAYFINVSQHQLRILIYTKEMDSDEMFERIACGMAGVSYERFVQGTLTPEEHELMEVVVFELVQLRENMMVVCLSGQDVGIGKDTVPWLQSKIEKYKPHVVFVDGMYLMSDATGAKKQHERVSNVSRGMRQLILRNKVPVIATVQANRQAAQNEQSNTEDVAFSDSLAQDCTMLVRVINEWKKGKDTIALVMGGSSRRYNIEGFRIYGYPAMNMGYCGELSVKEAEAISDDAPEKKEKQVVEKRGKRIASSSAARDVVSKGVEAAARHMKS